MSELLKLTILLVPVLAPGFLTYTLGADDPLFSSLQLIAMLLWGALGSLIALELVKRAARRRLKKRRTSWASAFLHQGFVNQNHSGFNKHKTPDRFFPISLVPPQGRIAVALPPVPVRDRRFKSYNPAVFVLRGALYACVRCSSYTLTADIQQPIITENFLYTFATNCYRHIDLPDTPRHAPALGFEDVRVLVRGDDVLLVATAYNRQGVNQMHLLTLSAQGVLSEGSIRARKVLPLIPDPSLAGPERRQKNWAPFLHGDRLMFVYSVQPHQVLKCDEQSGLCEIAHTVHTELPVQDLRGGTNLQLVNGAYVGFLHTTKPLQYDTYLYAFSATPPFQPVSFLDQQIFWARDWPIELPYVEFSTGFVILDRPEGTYWIISFGQNDSRPLIAIMSASQGLEMLAAGQRNLDECAVGSE